MGTVIRQISCSIRKGLLHIKCFLPGSGGRLPGRKDSSDMTNGVGLFEGLRNQVMGFISLLLILFPLWKATFILCWHDG